MRTNSLFSILEIEPGFEVLKIALFFEKGVPRERKREHENGFFFIFEVKVDGEEEEERERRGDVCKNAELSEYQKREKWESTIA